MGRLRTASRRVPGACARKPPRRSAERRRLRHRKPAAPGPQRAVTRFAVRAVTAVMPTHSSGSCKASLPCVPGCPRAPGGPRH